VRLKGVTRKLSRIWSPVWSHVCCGIVDCINILLVFLDRLEFAVFTLT